MTHLQNAPAEHWQVELVACALAGVILFAAVFFTLLLIAVLRGGREDAS